MEGWDSSNPADSYPAVASCDGWGLFSTSSNHADSEPAVTSGNNWGLFSTSFKPADCTQNDVLSSAAPRNEGSMKGAKKRSSSNRTLCTFGTAVLKKSSQRRNQ